MLVGKVLWSESKDFRGTSLSSTESLESRKPFQLIRTWRVYETRVKNESDFTRYVR